MRRHIIIIMALALPVLAQVRSIPIDTSLPEGKALVAAYEKAERVASATASVRHVSFLNQLIAGAIDDTTWSSGVVGQGEMTVVDVPPMDFSFIGGITVTVDSLDKPASSASYVQLRFSGSVTGPAKGVIRRAIQDAKDKYRAQDTGTNQVRIGRAYAEMFLPELNASLNE